MSSDPREPAPFLPRTARRRQERRRKRLLFAAGTLTAGLAFGGVLAMGLALSGEDSEVAVDDPPSPGGMSASPRDSPVAESTQQTAAGAEASASAAAPEPAKEPHR
ncbi:hypothetical protein ACFQZ2_22345, partial [Streptomonospora algeriensis]